MLPIQTVPYEHHTLSSDWTTSVYSLCMLGYCKTVRLSHRQYTRSIFTQIQYIVAVTILVLHRVTRCFLQLKMAKISAYYGVHIGGAFSRDAA